jgi:hypothetical protein
VEKLKLGEKEHKDTKARRHKETPQIKQIDAAFLCAFVPLCLCVFLAIG